MRSWDGGSDRDEGRVALRARAYENRDLQRRIRPHGRPLALEG